MIKVDSDDFKKALETNLKELSNDLYGVTIVKDALI